MEKYTAEILCDSKFGNSEFVAMVKVSFSFKRTSEDTVDILLIRISGTAQLLWQEGEPENDIHLKVAELIEEGSFKVVRNFRMSTIYAVAEIERCIRNDIHSAKTQAHRLDREEYLSNPLIASIKAIANNVLPDDSTQRKIQAKTLMREIRLETDIITHDYLLEALMAW